MSARPASLICALLLAGAFVSVRAEPIVPAGDDEVIEQLPAGGARAQERRARHELASHPDDPDRAASLAKDFLEQSRSQGDPRYAGLALAALRPWSDPATAPIEVLLLQATLDQHLHDFDAAAAKLERLLQRAPRHPQAWLTLATVRRVQGRYADADRACGGLARSGASLHARACQAENDGLRGRFDSARAELRALAAMPRLDGATRGWLMTTLAELEQRAGDDAAADAAWREALAAQADGYAVLAYADFLLARGRQDQVLALLRNQVRSDAVVLRRAMAGDAEAVRDMRERIALANQRPDSVSTHGREQAMFALFVERDGRHAVELARINLRRQREPVDLLLLAQAARASGDTAAAQEIRQLAATQGLVDRRWLPVPTARTT